MANYFYNDGQGNVVLAHPSQRCYCGTGEAMGVEPGRLYVILSDERGKTQFPLLELVDETDSPVEVADKRYQGGVKTIEEWSNLLQYD